MAQTIGLVQGITVYQTGIACVWIGASTANAELLLIRRTNADADHVGAFKNSILDGLVTAAAARQEVAVSHGDSNGWISALTYPNP